MDKLHTEHWQADQLTEQEMEHLDRFHRATARGFHSPVTNEDAAERWRQITAAQKMRMSLVYDRDAGSPALHENEPVHTYGGFPGRLNAGAGTDLPIYKITAVTVSPSYRRRGILGRQITEDLGYAKQQGYPWAALTASDARIYGRWGYGIASYENRFALECTDGLKLREPLPGRVMEVSAEQIEPHFDELAERCMAGTYGSIDASAFDRGYILGQLDGWENLAPAKDARLAAHYDQHGTLDGLISYKYQSRDSKPRAMTVRGLLAQNAAARVALLEFLGNHDLIGEVLGAGPVDDPLRLMLANDRNYKVEETRDVLWLRLLDPVAALQARAWSRDGSFVLVLRDQLGLADGTYQVRIEQGRAKVTPNPATEHRLPELSMDVSVLPRLYLASARLADLVDVGLVQCRSDRDLNELEMLFAQPRSAFTPYEF